MLRSLVRRHTMSVLSNGVSVVSENTGTAAGTIAVLVDSGSRAENKSNNGVAHFLEHLAFKGTPKMSRFDLEMKVESLGAQINAYTSRESTVYYAKSFGKDMPEMASMLSDILLNSSLTESAIEAERHTILREFEEVQKLKEEVVFDHLHATAFQTSSLGLTILGPPERIRSITRSDLKSYISENYTPERIVISAAGGVNHDAIVELAEKNFGHLKSADPLSAARRYPQAKFTGSEVRMRDDTDSTANIALAVEGCSFSSPDYFPLLVLQNIFGSWDRSLGSSSHNSAALSNIISENNLASSYQSFSTNYSDTGLFGIYLVSDSFTKLDDLVHFTLKEWTRMSMAPTQAEVERAKAQLKSALLLSLDGSTNIALDIGSQILTTGQRRTPAEIVKIIDSVTPSIIQKIAQKYLWDKDLAISAQGRIDGLLDYQRSEFAHFFTKEFVTDQSLVRADMSSMIW